MNLNIGDELDITKPSMADIQQHIHDLLYEDFVILSQSSQHYIQFYYSEVADDCVIEYRAGSENQHYQASFDTKDNVILAFASFLHGSDTYKTMYAWKLLTLSQTPPEKIAINHDEYSAKHIGRTPTGNQFFLTTPFVSSYNSTGCEYIALFQFDAEGNLIQHDIKTLGARATLDREKAKATYDALLQSLGDVSFERIEVKPFSIKHEGVEFGLIIRYPETDDDIFAVELQPGNYMAFFEPWDSGYYDT